MKKKLLAFFIVIYTTGLMAQATGIQWKKTFGGSGDDAFNAVQQTADGGYIVSGYTESSDGDVLSNHGETDVWVVKLSVLGDFEWQKTLGGFANEGGARVQQTTDGGYIVLGGSTLDGGHVSGNHGNTDAWVVKLSATGSIEWQKALGGTGEEHGHSICLAPDGGFIVAVQARSADGDITGQHGDIDAWIVKLSASGGIEWQKALGGSHQDTVYGIRPTSDGGYIMVGDTWSSDGDVVANDDGMGNVWVVKLSATGNIEWQKTYGGSDGDWGRSIEQTADGGYIFAAGTRSNDGDVTGYQGNEDFWVVKISSSGVLQWQKTLGGTSYEGINCVRQTATGGYIVSGYTQSNDGDVTGQHGDSDAWVVKLSATGALVWQRALGGTSVEDARMIQPTADGGYIMAGNTYSEDGDVSQNQGYEDAWVVKFDTDLATATFNKQAFEVFPNPARQFLHVKAIDGQPIEKIIVSDMAGKIVIDQSDNLQATNVQHLQQGTYIVRIFSEGKHYQQKFIKQ